MTEPMLEIQVHPHPLLDLGAFVARFPARLEDSPSPAELLELFALDAKAPMQANEPVRAAVRDLLRSGLFKPTGRNKPASEYLVRAVSERSLAFINLAVDACNVCSLHSGLPISVVDLDRATPPLVVSLAAAGQAYPFNSAGQIIDVGGLLCLADAHGPCANAVKDAQRTKTHGGTRNALYLIWGTRALPHRVGQVMDWCQSLLKSARVVCEDVRLI